MAVKPGRIVVLILVVAAVAAGGYAYLRYRDHEAGPGQNLVLYGNVEIRQVDLAFNVEGRIDQMLIEEGATVAKRQVLARLDDTRYRAAVDADLAAIEAQRAVVQRLEAGSRPQEIKKARADVEAAEAMWNTAQATLQRQRKLATDRYASQQALDDALANEREARGNLDALKETLALVIEGPRAEDIVKAKGDLNAARAELDLAKSRLADTVLYAPEDGVILTRIQEPGAVILANTPVYTLSLTDPVWVRAYISEPNLGRVVPGMKAEIITDTAPNKVYKGWVGFISPTAEFTPKTVQTTEIRTNLVYRLRVYAANPDRGLRQGMPVTVRLIEGSGGGDSTGGAQPDN
jgi:HlyD family secretion protein